MSNLDNDYLYKSGEIKLNILLDDNNFQEALNEIKVSSDEEDENLIQFLRLMVKYDMSYIKHFLNVEYHQKGHMTIPNNGWIHISPSLRDLSNRFDPIPMGYPEWFILMFPDVILWASYNDGHKLILNWMEDLENNKKIELLDPETNKLSLFILEEMIKKYLRYHKYLECSRIRV